MTRTGTFLIFCQPDNDIKFCMKGMKGLMQEWYHVHGDFLDAGMFVVLDGNQRNLYAGSRLQLSYYNLVLKCISLGRFTVKDYNPVSIQNFLNVQFITVYNCSFTGSHFMSPL